MRSWVVRLVMIGLLSLVIAPTMAGETRYVNTRSARVRECPRTNCKVVTTLKYAVPIDVIGEVEGQSVGGSTTWLEVQLVGKRGFVHESLTVTNDPTAARSNTRSTNSSSSSTAQSSSSAGVCPSFAATCSELTCTQAYACLAAGNGKLDRDHDGKPCETQCGG